MPRPGHKATPDAYQCCLTICHNGLMNTIFNLNSLENHRAQGELQGQGDDVHRKIQRCPAARATCGGRKERDIVFTVMIV
jgi:hypothetical protein